MGLTTPKGTTDDDSPSGGKEIALLGNDGHEIHIEGSKTRFHLEQATKGAWLADSATIVYLTGLGPYQIGRLHPADGQVRTLFEGHTFEAVVWDASRNQAFALGENLSVTGKPVIRSTGSIAGKPFGKSRESTRIREN